MIADCLHTNWILLYLIHSKLYGMEKLHEFRYTESNRQFNTQKIYSTHAHLYVYEMKEEDDQKTHSLFSFGGLILWLFLELSSIEVLYRNHYTVWLFIYTHSCGYNSRANCNVGGRIKKKKVDEEIIFETFEGCAFFLVARWSKERIIRLNSCHWKWLNPVLVNH